MRRRKPHTTHAAGSLAITYTGEPVRVDLSQIQPDMRVPDLTGEGALGRDVPGNVASTLFFEAILYGALVAPSGMTIDCYGTDDAGDPGFVLVAYAHDCPRRGVTAGWRSVKNIARITDYDPRDAGHEHMVREALEYFAAELNAALGVPHQRSEP